MNHGLNHPADTSARSTILRSIRKNLAESVALGLDSESEFEKEKNQECLPPARTEISSNGGQEKSGVGALDIFRERLEAVGGHSVIVSGESEAAGALTRIISGLEPISRRPRQIALSDAPFLVQLLSQSETSGHQILVTPVSAELFNCDIGITTAQAAIAETGTLVLESNCERHRLVSLVPPVHVALLKAADICLTLGEALKRVARDRGEQMSRAITFITGPSRTADIELTLSIGVHGPKELHVIVIN